MNRSFALLLLFAFSCSDGGSTSSVDPRKQLIDSWWRDFLGPELTELTHTTSAYRGAVKSYCDGQIGVGEARRAWGIAHRHVKRQQFFRFGPYVEFPERFVAKIDAWPAKPDAIDERIQNAEITFDSQYFESAVSTIRGFPSASYVLFSDDIDERDCEFLVGNADDLAAQTEALFVSWDPEQDGFYAEFQTMAAGDVAAELVNRLWHQTENISNNNIVEPMGLKGDGTPQPDQLEARFTDRTVAVMMNTMETISLLYEGDASVIGVASFVRSETLDAGIRAAIDDVNSRLNSIDVSMAEAIVSRRTDLQELIDALDKLQRLLEVDLLADLGFARSFNDQDGD